jgi:hypothetical protein
MALGGFADGAAAAKRPRGHPRAIELGEDGDMPGTTMCMPGYIVWPSMTMGATLLLAEGTHRRRGRPR